MGSFTKKEQIGILILVLVVVLSLGFKFVISDNIKPDDEISSANVENTDLDDLKETVNQVEANSENLEESSIIMVHISGQVYNPGIYELVKGDRVNDAVNLAGGLTKSADFDKINLAKKVVDEEKIYIPKIGENIGVEVDASIDSNSSTSDGKININTCSKEQLVSLPGIGDVIADRIIEYRNSNEFKNIDEIKNVSGIGDKKYEGIKDLIKVN